MQEDKEHNHTKKKVDKNNFENIPEMNNNKLEESKTRILQTRERKLGAHLVSYGK